MAVGGWGNDIHGVGVHPDLSVVGTSSHRPRRSKRAYADISTVSGRLLIRDTNTRHQDVLVNLYRPLAYPLLGACALAVLPLSQRRTPWLKHHEQYTTSDSNLGNGFVHLVNNSICKKSDHFGRVRASDE